MGYKILITAPDIDPKAMALLDRRGATVFTAPAYSSEDALAKIAASEQIDAIIVRVGKVSAKVIDASSRLRVLSKGGIGVDNIDVDHIDIFRSTDNLLICDIRHNLISGCTTIEHLINGIQ